jgi:hypothetical protein
MFIRNKLESYNMIKKLNLNLTNEVIFQRGQHDQVKKYLKNNPWEFYVIRDKKNSNSKSHRYNLTKNDVLQYIDECEIFSLAESTLNYESHRIVCGEIFIDQDWNLVASLDDGTYGAVRDCMVHPKYIWKFNLLEGYQPSIYGFNQVLDYIFSHELFGIVVEFSLYDIPVGVNKENIIIWELRNY